MLDWVFSYCYDYYVTIMNDFYFGTIFWLRKNSLMHAYGRLIALSIYCMNLHNSLKIPWHGDSMSIIDIIIVVQRCYVFWPALIVTNVFTIHIHSVAMSQQIPDSQWYNLREINEEYLRFCQWIARIDYNSQNEGW